MFLSVGIFHSTRIDKICSEEKELRKKRIKVAISAKKLHIGKTGNSLESVVSGHPKNARLVAAYRRG